MAFFFKQWGGRTPKAGGNVLDGRQWLEYPTVGDHDDQWWNENRARAAGAPASNAPMEVGPWAQEKLDCLKKYLDAYTTILRKQKWCERYFYIDAFAGPGALRVRREHDDPAQLSMLDSASHADDVGARTYVAGSPRVALEIEHPFTDYVFVETDDQRLRQLEELAKQYEARTRVHVRNVDCNTYLHKLIKDVGKRWNKNRGVVFLDPFGMQVPWDTMDALGRTEAIEVFVNFPVGMAIQRLLKRSGEFTTSERRKLDAFFGTSEWFDLLYRSDSDLLGEHVVKDAKSADKLVKWYRGRLREVFGYASAAREVQTEAGRPLYYLIFAGPNPTGATIANYVLKQGARIVR